MVHLTLEYPLKNLMPPFPVYERIRLLRLFSGLSQVDMAKMLKGSQAWLSKVESGKLEISAQHLFLLRVVFGVSSDAILDGIIPYYEVALRMNPEMILPAEYAANAKIPVRVLYPIVIALQSSKNKVVLPALTRQLKMKPFIFADPTMLVNEAFILDVLTHAKVVEFFDSKPSFENLKKEIVKGFAPLSLKGLSAQTAYDEGFRTEWLSLFHNMPKAQDVPVNLLAAPAVKPIFRSKAIRVG